MGTLMSLAVMRDSQGRGIGRQLVSAFLEISRKRQVDTVNLTTDVVDNDCANEFYRKMGFTCARAFATPEGRLMNEYIVRV
jgi:ribosomal protein S18 acetylase RimI-like enzyme